MRANKSMNPYRIDVVARDSNGGIAWVKNGSTYLYDPGPNTVFFENAITQGFSQWLGPEFTETFAKAQGAPRCSRARTPPPTVPARRFCAASLMSMARSRGPWCFDVASKLP